VAFSAPASPTESGPIQLRCWGVYGFGGDTHIDAVSMRESFRAFHAAYPHIQVTSSRTMLMPASGGGGAQDTMVPLMQIAGGIPEDVLYVDFARSDAYIRMKLLYPLDEYVEDLAGVSVRDGHLMDAESYFARLTGGPNGSEIDARVPRLCYEVMFRLCPYAATCPHLDARGLPPAPEHRHLWSFPGKTTIRGMVYRRDLFAEAGLPDRVPRDWEEMLEWGKLLTEPDERRFGYKVYDNQTGRQFLSFLYSAGGRLVEQDEQGDWRCVFDTPEAVEAAFFLARMRWEKFTTPKGKQAEGIIYRTSMMFSQVKEGMNTGIIDTRYFTYQDPNRYNFGPVPRGSTGVRGSEFNSRMLGLYAGLADQPRRRDAAWKYIHWYDGPQAREIRTRLFVEHGYGRFVNPDLLSLYGYPEMIRQVPRGWKESYEEAMANGIPRPYGRNCENAVVYPSHAVDEIWSRTDIGNAIQAGDEASARAMVREVLAKWVTIANREMLARLSPEQRSFRRAVAWIVVILTVVVFVYVFYRVFRIFTPAAQAGAGAWQIRRYNKAYLLVLPAISMILLWQYYPLARGTVMAFQDYNVRGFSEWVGMDNFARVLFDRKFWFSVWLACKYAALFMTFAFVTPIALAFLLQEIPRGKILYRVIYYLPAVLSGTIVLFLWKSFYAPTGPINELIGLTVDGFNRMFGTEIHYRPIDWLRHEKFAMPFSMLPIVWAGIGPGCLIYLAALKTVPDELYEAADIDGASIRHKVLQVAVPHIRVLIVINFIFAFVGAIRGSAGFMLAMTGGGPYGQTEVVGLHIFYTAFARLKFGLATAQAWIIGTFLIGFTVYQLKRLSQVEFKTADSNGK
jgi:multiple sugar transport system permease protein